MPSSLIVEKIIETSVGSVSLLSNGILHTDIHVNFEITVEICEIIFKAACELTDKRGFPNLFTFTKYVIPDAASRDYMVLPKRLAFTCADAIVINSLPQKIIGNFYLQMNKPSIPTKLFSNQNDAEDWLLKFIN